jgi:hypothetical protein
MNNDREIEPMKTPIALLLLGGITAAHADDLKKSDKQPSFPAAWQGSWCLAKTVNITRTSTDGFSVIMPSFRYQRGFCEPDKMALIEGGRFSDSVVSCQIVRGAFEVRCESDDEGDYDDHLTMSVNKDTLSVEFDGEITRTDQ